MSLPRPILRGTCYLVTKRTSGRRFFLRPSKRLNRTIEYIVGCVAKRTGVLIHALCVLSNHYHLVASDPLGRMPEFLRDLHALTAKTVNVAIGHWENVWSTKQTSLVRLEADEDVCDEFAYTMANPVSSFLVAKASSWPGLRVAWPEKRKSVERPKGFFRKNGPMPERVTLELARPPGYENVSDHELAALLAKVTASKAGQARVKAAAQGIRFLGRRAALRQDPFDSPRTREAHRGLSPRVAAKDKCRRIEALGRLSGFLCDYRKALSMWLAGMRDVVFPSGTYAMRVRFRVRCAPS